MNRQPSHQRSGYLSFTVDYAISLEQRPYGLLQILGSWLSLINYVDPGTALDLMTPSDLIVRKRLTGEVVYRHGPFCGSDGQRLAVEAHWMINNVGIEEFLATADGLC
jgi:hypothetical protein